MISLMDTLLLAGAMVTTPPHVPPPPQADFFIAGNEAYQSGAYDEALNNYLRIVEAGFESSPLYYNIGNTYFKLGNLGRSILNYERAARLDPRNADVLTNLALARSLTSDEITPLPTFWLFRITSWWVHAIPPTLLTIFTAAAYLMTIAALVGVTVSNAPTMLTRSAFAAGAVTVALTVNLLAVELGWGNTVEAVVLQPEAPVYSAPSDDPALLVFNVHEGTLVRIDEKAGDWIEIVLEDGNVGWMKGEATETI